MPLRKYLQSRRGGGANYLANALQTYAVLGFTFWFVGRLFYVPQSNIEKIKENARVENIVIEPTPTYMTVYLVPGINTGGDIGTVVPTLQETAQPVLTADTPVPTKLPYAVDAINFVFSYYYPPLVGVDYEKYSANCHPDNLVYGDMGRVINCKDVTASGERWSEWVMDKAYDKNYRGGVAVSYNPDTCPRAHENIYDVTCEPLYPMGSELVVVDPWEIAGVYLVMDICPGCGLYLQSDGVLFLDFVSDKMPPNVWFWTPVNVAEVFYPWEVER